MQPSLVGVGLCQHYNDAFGEQIWLTKDDYWCPAYEAAAQPEAVTDTAEKIFADKAWQQIHIAWDGRTEPGPQMSRTNAGTQYITFAGDAVKPEGKAVAHITPASEKETEAWNFVQNLLEAFPPQDGMRLIWRRTPEWVGGDDMGYWYARFAIEPVAQ